MHPLPSQARADFSIMMECTPEIGNCHSVCMYILCGGNSFTVRVTHYISIKSVDNNFLSRGTNIVSQSRLYVLPQGKISDKKISNTTPNGRYKFWQKQKKILKNYSWIHSAAE